MFYLALLAHPLILILIFVGCFYLLTNGMSFLKKRDSIADDPFFKQDNIYDDFK